MLEVKDPEKLERKTCESCGEEFSCGAKSGKCWCFEVDLNSETLENLRKNFENCLCEKCLEK
jgi:hypothetical protein